MNRVRSLGLDLSATAPGLVLLEWIKGDPIIDLLEAQTIPIPKNIDRYGRVSHIADVVMAVVKEYGPDEIVIEGYGQTSKQGVQSFIKLVEVGTEVRMRLVREGLNIWIEVPPVSLKKFVTGTGKLPSGAKGKKEMIRAVERHWGFATTDHNIADALGLAAFGLARRGVLSVRPEQLDALDGVKCRA